MLKRRCPFIGLANDPQTVVGFPSIRNRCHRMDSEGQVRPEYQLSHCLTFNHRNCPILLGEADNKQIAEIAVVPWKRRTAVYVGGIATVFAVAVISVFLFSGWQWAGANDGNQSTEGRPALQIPPDTHTILSPSLTSTDTTVAVPTATAVPPTEAPSPTQTPEPTTLPATETQQSATATVEPTSCGAPEGWVIYTVKIGDTLASIAAGHGVTQAQLQAANCLSSTEIFVGQQLYVPSVPQATPIPSLTPTLRPTIPLPTATPFPTNTPAPSNTPEPTVTASDLPTDTPIPSETPMPTNTDTPIPTNTPIPLPTDTPAFTATSTPITLPPTDTPGP